MTPAEVLKTSRGFIRAGHSPVSASFGDWPDAVAAYDCANPWWRPIVWLPSVLCTRAMLIRSLDRAIKVADGNC